MFAPIFHQGRFVAWAVNKCHIIDTGAHIPANVDFYARVLGLRLGKKTVNFDAPDVYHLYYGDERGAHGSILTFFEFPGAAPGRAGDGMIHRLRWRVGSDDALGFWDRACAHPCSKSH